jgi:hypothetical protein
MLDNPAVCKPDYSLTTNQVYTRFAARLVEQGFFHTVIYLAGTQHNSGSRQAHSVAANIGGTVHELPSWVPDLRFDFRAYEANYLYTVDTIYLIWEKGVSLKLEATLVTFAELRARDQLDHLGKYGHREDLAEAGVVCRFELSDTASEKWMFVLRSLHEASSAFEMVGFVECEPSAEVLFGSNPRYQTIFLY